MTEVTTFYKAKGGVASTLSAIYYACALARVHGPDQVVLLDADKGTRSVDKYITRRVKNHGFDAELPFLVEEWNPGKGPLATFAIEALKRTGPVKHLVIDMGADPSYAINAALLADTIIMPIKPWETDYETIDDLMSGLNENEAAKKFVLLTIVDRPRQGEAATARADITKKYAAKYGVTVLETEVKKQAKYRSYHKNGDVPDELWAYEGVYAEINGGHLLDGSAFDPGMDLNPRG